ncbi:MAG: hypothetical protein ACPGXY_01685 [Alphaproteobacteria bacterium]
MAEKYRVTNATKGKNRMFLWIFMLVCAIFYGLGMLKIQGY